LRSFYHSFKARNALRPDKRNEDWVKKQKNKQEKKNCFGGGGGGQKILGASMSKAMTGHGVFLVFFGVGVFCVLLIILWLGLLVEFKYYRVDIGGGKKKRNKNKGKKKKKWAKKKKKRKTKKKHFGKTKTKKTLGGAG